MRIFRPGRFRTGKLSRITPGVWLLIQLVILGIGFMACDKESPVEVKKEEPTVKDGIITVRFSEYPEDTSTHLPPIFIDSLNISETANVIEISNAVPFELPTLEYVDVYFNGDFFGVQDTIYYWWECTEEDYRTGKKWRKTEMSQIPKNMSEIRIPAINPSWGMRDVKGYFFILDSDNDNSGTGYIAFKHKSVPLADTIWVDAAKNTVVYTQNSAIVEFTKKYDTTLEILTPKSEIDSYRNLPDRAICVVQAIYPNHTQILAISTQITYGWDFQTQKFKVFGFAPKFVKPIV